MEEKKQAEFVCRILGGRALPLVGLAPLNVLVVACIGIRVVVYVVVAWNLYHSICVLVLRRCKQPIEIVLGLFFSSIWDIKIPPRVQYFLWLISKNKLLTRDNLSKRRKVEDPTCLFCNERESIQHLFFSCAIAKQLWHVLSKIFDI
jgi:hypothetical protein